MKTTEQIAEAFNLAFDAAFPIHQQTALNLAKAHGVKVALDYLKVAGNPPPAPARIRPPAKRIKPASKTIYNVACTKCDNQTSWSVGGGHSGKGRYRTYQCTECLKCQRIYAD